MTTAVAGVTINILKKKWKGWYMEEMTITEALAEIKLLQKKIESKRSTVTSNLVRQKQMPDPFQSDGGGQQVMTREIQAVTDLFTRLVSIRGAIAEANLTNKITVAEETKSIHDWLTWKREVAEPLRNFYQTIHVTIKEALIRQSTNPVVYKDEEGKVHMVEMVPNADYAEFIKRAEKTQDKFERLDGLLSLRNATITVKF